MTLGSSARRGIASGEAYNPRVDMAILELGTGVPIVGALSRILCERRSRWLFPGQSYLCFLRPRIVDYLAGEDRGQGLVA